MSAMVVAAPRTRRAPPPPEARARPPARAEPRRLDLERVAARWQRALDAAGGALRVGRRLVRVGVFSAAR